MKRTLCLLSVLLTTLYISAQVKTAIQVAPQLSDYFGVRAGIDIDIPFNRRWSLMPGIYWSLRHKERNNTRRINDVTIDTHTDSKAHYLSIPIRAAVRVAGRPDGNFMMKILFGPYIAYGLGGTSQKDITKDGVATHYEYDTFSSEGICETRWDYGLNAGLSMQFKQHFLLGAFYEIGFRRIYRPYNIIDAIGNEAFLTNRNIGIGISLGYRF